jgi:hypothetical protein
MTGASEAAATKWSITSAGSFLNAGTNTIDMNAGELILDADQDTSITASTDDQIDFRVGGTDRLVLTNDTVTTNSSVGISLGKDGANSAGGLAMYFAGDTNTGFYRSATDTFEIVAGGTRTLAVGNGTIKVLGSTLGPDGSTSDPTFAFTSDTDTGIYLVNAGQLGVTCGNDLMLRIQDDSIRMQAAGAVDAPSYTWNDYTGTGLYVVSPDMRITVDGVFSASFTDDGAGLGNRILFGKTSEGDVATAGWDFSSNSASNSNAYGTSTTTHPLLLNRHDNDGTIIDIQQANSTEGTISVSGTTVSYNGAHLSRWSQLADNAKAEIHRGTVMAGIDEMCQWWMESWTDTTLVKGGVVVPRVKNSSMNLSLGHADGDTYEDENEDIRTISLKQNNQLTRCKISDAESDKAVLGVFEKYEADTEDEKNYNDLVIAQSGDFVIRVGSDFDGEVGDLLESAGDGTAKIQDDDVVRSKTIARVTGSTTIHEYEDGSFAIPCILMIA